MTELRLYLQRDGLRDGLACPWVLLDREGHVQRAGTSLADAPRAGLSRLILEADRVAIVEADLPPLPERKLAPLLANAVETGTLDEAENLHVTLLGRNARGKGACAVVSTAWLERALRILAEHDIHPDAVLPEGLLLPWEPGAWSVVANEGANILRLDAHRALVVDAGDPPAGLRLALAREGAPKVIRIYQGNCLRMPDLEAWRSALGTRVETAGGWDWRTASWREPATLLTGRFAARRARLDFSSLLKPLLWGGLALAVIQVAGLSLDTFLLRREQDALRTEQQRLARRVLPAEATLVEPLLQVTTLLERSRPSAGASGENGMPALLTRLAGVWPSTPGPSLRAVVYSEGALEITLAGRAESWMDQLRNAAAPAGLTVAAEDGKAMNGNAVNGNAQDTTLRVRVATRGDAHGR